MDYKSLYNNKNFTNIDFNKDLKDFTTFGIGGPADVLIRPTSIEELEEVLKFNHDNNIETFVMGKGSNLLVSDKGIRECVIVLADNFDRIKIEGDYLTALAGTSLNKASLAAINAGLSSSGAAKRATLAPRRTSLPQMLAACRDDDLRRYLQAD